MGMVDPVANLWQTKMNVENPWRSPKENDREGFPMFPMFNLLQHIKKHLQVPGSS